MRRRRREDVRASPAAGTPPPVADEAEEPPKPLPTRYAFRAWSADDGAPVPYLEDSYAQRELRLLCGLVFCVSLAVYVRCLYPSVPGGDSGELILSACRLGIAHPPGYPTFVMLGRLFIELFRPFGSVAWRMNLMSAVLGASSSAGLLAAAATWTQNHPAALLGALMWAFSPLAWLYSTQAEVFALNNAIVSVFLYFFIRYLKYRERWVAYAGAFTFGVGGTNQHTIVLFGIPMALCVLWAGRRDLWNFPALLRFGLLFAGGMAPYAYMPFGSWHAPEGSWGDITTPAGFVRHFLRSEYGTFRLANMDEKSNLGAVLERLALYARNLAPQATYPGYALAAVGFMRIFRVTAAPHPRDGPDRLLPVGRALLLTYAFYMAVFNYLANLPLEKEQFQGIFARFWMQPNLVFFSWLACGAADLSEIAAGFSGLLGAAEGEEEEEGERRARGKKRKEEEKGGGAGTGRPRKGGAGRARLAQAALLLACVALPAFQAARHWHSSDFHSSRHIEQFGRGLLAPLPANATLLTKGDLIVNSARYVQLCEGFRPDIAILDQELMSLKWFRRVRPFFEPNVKFPGTHYHPRERGAFTMKSLIDSNYRGPDSVFMAGGWKEDPDTRHQNEFQLIPYGLVSRLVRKSDYPSGISFEAWKEYMELADKATVPPSSFPFPLDRKKFGPETWEHVVDNDYWEARHRKGYETLMWAIERNNHEEALVLAARLLEREEKENPTQPDHIYKNLGITYGRLAQIDGVKYVPLMIRHFGTYIERAERAKEADKDLKVIKDTVEHARQSMKSWEGAAGAGQGQAQATAAPAPAAAEKEAEAASTEAPAAAGGKRRPRGKKIGDTPG